MRTLILCTAAAISVCIVIFRMQQSNEIVQSATHIIAIRPSITLQGKVKSRILSLRRKAVLEQRRQMLVLAGRDDMHSSPVWAGVSSEGKWASLSGVDSPGFFLNNPMVIAGLTSRRVLPNLNPRDSSGLRCGRAIFNGDSRKLVIEYEASSSSGPREFTLNVSNAKDCGFVHCDFYPERSYGFDVRKFPVHFVCTQVYKTLKRGDEEINELYQEGRPLESLKLRSLPAQLYMRFWKEASGLDSLDHDLTVVLRVVALRGEVVPPEILNPTPTQQNRW